MNCLPPAKAGGPLRHLQLQIFSSVEMMEACPSRPSHPKPITPPSPRSPPRRRSAGARRAGLLRVVLPPQSQAARRPCRVQRFCWMIAGRAARQRLLDQQRHRPSPAPGRRVAAALQSLPTDENSAGCEGGEIDTRLAMFRDRLTEIYAGGLELPAVASRSEAAARARSLQPHGERVRNPERVFWISPKGAVSTRSPPATPRGTRLESLCYRPAA